MITKTRKIVSSLFTLALVLPCAFAADPATQPPPQLPLGCWTFNANGTQGQLCIPSLESDGSFTGTAKFTGYSNIVTGFWSSGAQQLSFLRLGVTTDPFSFQSFTGYLFPVEATDPSGPQMLAGSFTVFGTAGGAIPSRNMYGWTATIF
jgi:hypothetical protein